MDIEVIRDPAAFRALQGAWQDLFGRALRPHFFQRFDWLWDAWELVAAPKGRQLFIVVGRVDGRVVLILPLTLYGPNLLKFLASDRGEYRDVLVESGPNSEAWVGKAFDAVMAMTKADILYLQDLQAHSLLKRVVEARGMRTRTRIRPAPRIDLRQWSNFQGYFGSLSRKLRHDQTRQWRRLAEIGSTEFAVVESRDAILETMTWIYEQKLVWQRNRNISNPSFSNAYYVEFLRTAVLRALDSGMLHVCRLTVGDTVVAASIAFHDNREYTFYMFAFDEDWGNYSPGRLLMEKSVEWAMAHGLSSYDLMLSTLDYKRRWTDDASDITDFLIPCSRVGVLIVAWYSSVLRRKLLGFVWHNAPRRLFSIAPRSVRRVAESVLLSRWGDPYEDY